MTNAISIPDAPYRDILVIAQKQREWKAVLHVIKCLVERDRARIECTRKCGSVDITLGRLRVPLPDSKDNEFNSISFVLMHGHGQGPICAAVQISQMCMLLKPRNVVMLGSCAGVRTEQKIGDVVYSSQVVDATPGVQRTDNKQDFRPNEYTAAHAKGLVEACKLVNDHRNRGTDKIVNELISGEWNVIDAKMVSGALIDHSEGSIAKSVTADTSSPLAYEMEGAAMFIAMNELQNTAPLAGHQAPENLGVIKGIMDLASEESRNSKHTDIDNDKKIKQNDPNNAKNNKIDWIDVDFTKLNKADKQFYATCRAAAVFLTLGIAKQFGASTESVLEARQYHAMLTHSKLLKDESAIYKEQLLKFYQDKYGQESSEKCLKISTGESDSCYVYYKTANDVVVDNDLIESDSDRSKYLLDLCNASTTQVTLKVPVSQLKGFASWIEGNPDAATELCKFSTWVGSLKSIQKQLPDVYAKYKEKKNGSEKQLKVEVSTRRPPGVKVDSLEGVELGDTRRQHTIQPPVEATAASSSTKRRRLDNI